MLRSLLLLLILATLGSCHHYMVATGPQRVTRATDQLKTQPQRYPTIRSLHVTSDIKYRYATTVVSTRVINPYDVPGQARFSVTLPESAFISEFLMVVEDKVYKAHVKDKDEAKSIYQGAVDDGRFAGHAALNARNSNQFLVSVNIEAKGKVTFNLTYEELLTRSLGLYSNIIHINTQQIVDDFSVIVNIEETKAIVDLQEASELQLNKDLSIEKRKTYAKIEEKSPNHKSVIWSLTPEEQRTINIIGVNGQFIVKYDIDREETSQILVIDGYFVHFFAPDDLPKLPKHVVFVLDFSASMRGRKLRQLKEAMDQILSDLGPDDYFSIVIFQSWIEAWSPSSKYTTGTRSRRGRQRIWKSGKLSSLFVVPATPDNIKQARNFLNNYSHLRSTNVMGGLRTGLELIDIGEKQWANEDDPPQAVLILLSDGQPNIEESNTEVIISKTKQLNKNENPIYSLAFGYDADINFLRKLSLQNFGFNRLIYEAADAAQQLKNFYLSIASPLLSDVKFTYIPEQVDMTYQTKQEFPVFHKGSEIVVAGKIKNENLANDTPIGELVGVTATGTKTYTITNSLTLQKQQNRPIGHMEKVWSYLTIRQLLDKADSLDNGEDKKQTRKKALDLALQYGFVTPLTSLVVVKPDGTKTPVDPTKVKPVDPEGVLFPTDDTATPGPHGIDIRFGETNRQPVPQTNNISPEDENRFGGWEPEQPNTNKINTGSTDEDDTVIQAEQKTSLEQVTWLQHTLKSTDSTKTVTVDGVVYKVATNEVNTSFGDCRVNGESGECHHLQHCALDVFQGNITQFLPYKCFIPGNFLGVCCPEYLL